jgi:hypothetical protein
MPGVTLRGSDRYAESLENPEKAEKSMYFKQNNGRHGLS